MSEHDSKSDPTTTGGGDFIRQMIDRDLETGKYDGRVVTRFPPEPNGYLHIGHAKSICLNFGIAEEYEGGICNLRFDDTNPLTEDPEYVEAIQVDVRWLGYDWEDRLYFASDYFERLYEKAEELVLAGKAYVDSSSEEEIREARGTVTEPGRPSPDRERSVEENLDLLRRMKAGELPDGAAVLRAKIDLAHPNMKMRDPLLYRIRHASHYRRGDEWCIYPFYDFTHCLSDAFEGITQSLCTLEFENNRDIYDWVLDNVETEYRPEQTEFARLALSYTVLSKRKLLELVEGGFVDGWDDPRMPTLRGFRRRGYTPEAIRAFCDRVGVAKASSTIDVAQLEHAIRDDLNYRAPRVMAVLHPLDLVVENYPEGESEWLDAPSWPHDVGKEGSREIPFSGTLFIERDDFAADPPKGFYRLSPGREVRLRHGYLVTCTGFDADDSGEVTRVRCTYDPATRGGAAPDGRKVRGTIHWVSAAHAVDAEVRLYDRLFADERPDRGKGGPDYKQFLHPDSLEVLAGCKLEPSLATAEPGERFQFERQGYFYLEPESSTPGAPVFNRVVTLKDTWARIEARRSAAPATSPRAFVDEPAPAPAPEPTDPLAGLEAGALETAIRLRDEVGLAPDDARLLAEDAPLGAYFEAASAVEGAAARSVATYLINELRGAAGGRDLGELPFGPEALGELVALAEAGAITGPAAKEVLAAMVDGEGAPGEIVATRGLERLADEALAELVDETVEAHPDKVSAYRDGKSQLLGFFMGQVIQASRGKADPEGAKRLLLERLGG